MKYESTEQFLLKRIEELEEENDSLKHLDASNLAILEKARDQLKEDKVNLARFRNILNDIYATLRVSRTLAGTAQFIHVHSECFGNICDEQQFERMLNAFDGHFTSDEVAEKEAREKAKKATETRNEEKRKMADLPNEFVGNEDERETDKESSNANEGTVTSEG